MPKHDTSLQRIHELHARAIYNKATRACSGGLVDGEDCSWYHGAWPVLRALGLVSNPYWHFEFFRKHLEGRLNGSFLVLGTADASTPYLLSYLGAQCIDIVDVCPTPLHACSLAAQRLGLDWNTVAGNALELHEVPIRPKYHNIINDAFLTRFDQVSKERISSIIRERLLDDGVYISSARITEGDEDFIADGYQSAEIKRRYFVERAVSKFHESGGLSDFTEQEISSICEGYMRKMVSYRFSSVDHLRDTLLAGGLKMIASDVVTTPGESEESDYVRFVAVRA